MAVAVILVPVVMVAAFVMEMAEGASFIDRDVGIAFHDVDLIVLVLCHFRIVRVVMMLFRDLFAAATAASAMFMGVTFVVMTAAASVLVGVAFVVMVMTAAAAVFVGVTFVIMVMSAAAAVFVGVAFVVMPTATATAVFVRVAFVFVVMSAAATVFVRMAFVVVVMPTTAAVGFFVFLVVGMLFGVMGSFLRLMAVAAPTVMYMLFIVLFHGMSPYLEWKFSFLSGIILWCYFSILQMHRKWSMRNTLIFQVGQGETIGLDRTKKGMGSRGGVKMRNEK